MIMASNSDNKNNHNLKKIQDIFRSNTKINNGKLYRQSTNFEILNDITSLNVVCFIGNNNYEDNNNNNNNNNNILKKNNTSDTLPLIPLPLHYIEDKDEYVCLPYFDVNRNIYVDFYTGKDIDINLKYGLLNLYLTIHRDLK